MPAPTVTVWACASNATTSSIGFSERRFCVLSAMSLKQWRVPRTLSLLCFLTNSCTCSSELAEYKRSVPYSRLPAQFFSLLLDAQANRGEMTGLAIIAAKSLIKVLLFTAIAVSTLGTGIPLLWLRKPRQLYACPYPSGGVGSGGRA